MRVSAKTQHGIEALKAMMKDKVCMFSGHSGVGKSTLVNALQPGLNLKPKQFQIRMLRDNILQLLLKCLI